MALWQGDTFGINVDLWFGLFFFFFLSIIFHVAFRQDWIKINGRKED